MLRTLNFLLIMTVVLSPLLAQLDRGALTITASGRSRIPGISPPALRGGTPYNDLCQNANVQVLSQGGSVTITGDNTGSTDTEDFGNPVSWEAFMIDTCTTVTVSYCGTDPLFGLVYSILIVGCPEFIANVQNSGTADCGDGNTTITYANLPAGTYHVPVLRTAGAVGPYTMTFTSAVCETPPLNDICANATVVEVLQDCAQGLVMGNNGNAVINSVPPCSPTSSQIQDVWYRFNSGENAEVLITIDPGTIGDIGVEVRSACGGPSVFCASGDTSYTVAVVPATNYRVRVFSNNDFGFGGTFGICITPPPGSCDAGTVTINGGGTAIIVCANGGDPIILEQNAASGEAVALMLTDASDNIVALLPDNVLDAADLAPGEYRVWPLAYEGALVGTDAGQPLSGITASGSCLDLGAAPVVITVEICQGLQPANAPVPAFVLMGSESGPLLRWEGPAQFIVVELFDGRGLLVHRLAVPAQQGQVSRLVPTAALAGGLYTVRVLPDVGSPLAGRIFVP